MNTKILTHNSYPKQIHDLVSLYEKGQLNLTPGFQRNSVWTKKDRAKLIESILKNYPLPAIFLYRREDGGKIIYDVIDGKQRLESIFMFMGHIRGNKFSTRTEFEGESEVIEIDWSYLKKKNKQAIIEGYRLYAIEVDGNISDIIDLFVRINSTGKALTAAEKQHAKYFDKSPLLKTAMGIAKKYEDYFSKSGVLTFAQITRMKHVELICEIMISIGNEDVINKKAALDRVMGKGLTTIQLSKIKQATIGALNLVKRMFPQLHETRFKQISDYYVLVLLIARYEKEGLVLNNKGKNQLAWDLLREFSNGVDRVRLRQRKAEGIDESDNLYREYHLTVSQATDDISQRRTRMRILDNILRSLFATKDKQRSFSPEQRRIIWNSADEKICQECGETLTWNNFTLDHIDPHSRGGRSEIENASLMCQQHNSAKGNRPARRRA